MTGKIGNREALVFGANGMVGNCLVKILNDHVSFSSVRVFTRKPVNYNLLKINELVIDFDKLEDYGHLIKGDDLFICLGTTIKKAGSVKKVEEIDRDLPVRIAKIAHSNGVTRIAVVSSIGADPASRNYYLRIKGEMEAEIRKIPFEQIVIARPSILLGKRNEFRLGELFGKVFIRIFGFLLIGPAKKYRGIKAQTVALSMVRLIKSTQRDILYQSDELKKFGRR